MKVHARSRHYRHQGDYITGLCQRCSGDGCASCFHHGTVTYVADSLIGHRMLVKMHAELGQLPISNDHVVSPLWPDARAVVLCEEGVPTPLKPGKCIPISQSEWENLPVGGG